MLGFLRETPWVLRGEGELHTLTNYHRIAGLIVGRILFLLAL